jgi:hypothetical protein
VFPGHKGNRVEDACIILLGENTRGNKVRSVCFNKNFSRRIKVPEDRGRGESSFKGLKCLLADRRPLEYNTFVGKGDEGPNKTGESTDKTTVEVSEAKKALDVLKV